ncbi:hypothetical protein I3843_03G144100 [Carya illinoinensis]|uniref:RING-type domain-containing protein n=1 Tax=Carya illinoinensis TaxID=32201 RepID=A0A922FM04_CARIL|nr:hypothetical protein I3842_03G142000 [Carya illinoinensis]KAG6722041.1 hypothetical protein I3842_03G142000 [Carya illinoinensis]KAG7987629.1 hypothetical protein I3843_03G144100 [Carya illinoinensis]KAG7987630.1 hypothetical protein I3843_03G144100 [Carya illinoinensis]
MSAVNGGIREPPAGLTLGDILLGTAEKRAALAPPVPRTRDQSAPATRLRPQLSNRTLLDVIQEHDPDARLSFKDLIGDDHNNRDKNYWKNFKDRLNLKRAGANWTSRIPASDIPIQNGNDTFTSSASLELSFSVTNSVRFQHTAESTQLEDDSTSFDMCGGHSSSSSPCTRPQMSRRSSTRLGPSVPIESRSTPPGDSDFYHAPPPSQAQGFGRQISRQNATRHPATQSQNSMLNRYVADFTSTEEGYAECDGDEASIRAPRPRLSTVLAEERALSAREAVAAQEAAEAVAAAERDQAETEESEAAEPPARMSLMDLMDYNIGEEEEEEEEEAKAEEEGEVVGGGGGVEHKCCVCMVRHKGAAFIPCGHTFCRLCSRELMVGRGNCPLCNRFILEILDIF